MFSVNQMNCYHVLIEAFNVIRYGSSKRIQEKWIGNSTSHYSSRRSNNVKVPRVDHVRCEGFSFYGAKMWNSLPEEIKATENSDNFKVKIKNWIWERIPSY